MVDPKLQQSTAEQLATDPPWPEAASPHPHRLRLILRGHQSPRRPNGIQGDLEVELLGLANALYNLGTTVVNDLTKEKDKPGGGKQVGIRVNDVINHLAVLDDVSQHITTMIPMQGETRESCDGEPIYERQNTCDRFVPEIPG
ncbi:hypothetical protein A0H81_13404 [Grifola frondosa]|uniref:Mediator of RNA polymerase II transcription subunit 10 n=1 Tax=Grifola frondosa TaxID=5627 RepID=A0A1C7LPE3_GRIFR|nr:hypothetical protein A0H81_13404 [Grifola frondosa]